ncbi:MAG: hypothetical protein KGN84_06540 [Acidobacteriota bacterium]|nr:hypothetical protein [Acidobacteriota bacterium]
MRVRTISLALFFAAALAGDINTNADSPKETALALAKRAKKAQKRGHNAEAYLLYSEALALQPASRRYRAQMNLLQTRATAESKPVPPAPDSTPAPHISIPPEDLFDSLTEKEMAEARPLSDVPHLAAKSGQRSFDLNAAPRVLFERVADAFGLQTVYDGDYPQAGPSIRFRLSEVDYREAIHDLEAATNSFVVPLSSKLFMVAQDTPTKRNDLERTMAISVPIPPALTTQEITQIAQAIRQTTSVEKISWNTSASTIVMRDRVSRVIPAIAILDQLISYRPEVMIDLEFLQLSASDMQTYGFDVANTFSATYLGHILNNVVMAPGGVTNLLYFGGGKTLVALTAAQVQTMFNETISTANSVYHGQIRSVAGQPASFHAGEKYPVITGGYYGNVAPNSGTIYSPPPSFTYEDLGIKLKVTPYVNGMNGSTLDVETSFEVLTGSSIDGIPVIGTRSVKSVVGVKNGEWAIVGTLVAKTRSKAVSGFWGLAQIPVVGQLFRQTTTDDEDSNILIGVRTRLLSLPPDQIVTRRLYVGSDARPLSPL